MSARQIQGTTSKVCATVGTSAVARGRLTSFSRKSGDLVIVEGEVDDGFSEL